MPLGAHRRRVLRRARPMTRRRREPRAGLPVLRKDFTVAARDVCDARLMGADCVLLIAAALDADELRRLPRARPRRRPRRARRDPRRGRARRAVAAGATSSASTSATSSPSRSTPPGPCAWPPQMPAGVVRVAESGVTGAGRRRARSPTPATTPCSWARPWSPRRDPARSVADLRSAGRPIPRHRPVGDRRRQTSR